jgi:putative ABC transport system permease protein
MYRSYFKIAVRNLLKYKGYAFINIAGLAIGLACCFLIILFVRHELSYDRFHEKAARVYRLLHASKSDPKDQSAVSASAYAPHLLHEFPEIEQAVRFFTNAGAANLKSESEVRTVNGLVFADASVFQVFSFRLLRGDPATALDAPNGVVLTSAAAQSWFGNENPLGRTLFYLNDGQRLPLQITGVMEDVPSSSHLQFDCLVSFNLLKTLRGEDALSEYINFNYYTYLLLRENVAPQQLAPRFPDFMRKYRDENTAANTLLVLQPLDEIHLNTSIRWDVGTNSEKKHLYIFSAVALLILLIASINFVNLATARATLRAKEVGVRKVVGANRAQVLQQMFGESLLASAFAVILALGLLQIAAPVVRDVLGRAFSLEVFNSLPLLLALAAAVLLTGMLAGVYPALVLSSFEPISVLKRLVTKGVRGARLRRSLIVAQFGISVFLLMAMITVYRQLQYMKTRDLGFAKEQVVFVGLSGAVKQHFEAFRAKLLEHAQIKQVALGSVPGRVRTSRGYMWPGLENENEDSRDFYTMFADPHSLEALEVELAAGRNFSEEIPTDVKHAYILNETAVRELGWENPVGQPFRVWDEEMGQVVGVVKDFNFRSLHQKIDPLVLDMKPEWSGTAIIRVAPGDLRTVLQLIETQWREFEPELLCNVIFLDADFERLYRAEERLGRLFSGFTFLAIFVACLGLLGLAAFTTQQRTKEIGIRKVLGASVRDILLLLSKEFTRLVLWAFAAAVPVAYIAMNTWLENFAYRTAQGFIPFLVCGATVLALALLTVSSQALRAALGNPAEALRYE